MQNVDQTVISQYANSAVLCQWIANYNACIDPNFNLERFFYECWLIDTAVGYGLDAIGRKVGIGRVVTIASADYLGFSGASGASGDSFNAGIWYSGGATTVNFALTDDSYRLLILAKAAANITNGSIPALNQILLTLFPHRGNCFVEDGLDMTLTYVFDFPLEPFEAAIVTNGSVLPTPTGVFANYNYTQAVGA